VRIILIKYNTLNAIEITKGSVKFSAVAIENERERKTPHFRNMGT
jgi:hypothetical protein